MKPYKYQKIKIEWAEIETKKIELMSQLYHFESIYFWEALSKNSLFRDWSFQQIDSLYSDTKIDNLRGKLTQIWSVYSKVNISHYFSYCVILKRAHFGIPELELTVNRNCEGSFFFFEILTNSFFELFCPSNILNIHVQKWNHHIIILPFYQG